MTAFTNTSHTKRQVSFASPYPGKIIPLDLLELGGKVICQKDAFLCAAKGVSIGIDFQRRLGTGSRRISTPSLRLVAQAFPFWVSIFQILKY